MENKNKNKNKRLLCKLNMFILYVYLPISFNKATFSTNCLFLSYNGYCYLWAIQGVL